MCISSTSIHYLVDVSQRRFNNLSRRCMSLSIVTCYFYFVQIKHLTKFETEALPFDILINAQDPDTFGPILLAGTI